MSKTSLDDLIVEEKNFFQKKLAKKKERITFSPKSIYSKNEILMMNGLRFIKYFKNLRKIF